MKIRLGAAALASLLALAPLQATQAGQLFPPSNIGSNPNAACPSNEVLTWTGDTVACVDPTLGIKISCPAGQVLANITLGKPNCVTPNGTDPFRVWATMEGLGQWPTAVVASYTDGFGNLQHFLMQISNRVVTHAAGPNAVAYVSANAIAGGAYCGYDQPSGKLVTTYNISRCPPQLTIDGTVTVQPLP